MLIRLLRRGVIRQYSDISLFFRIYDATNIILLISEGIISSVRR